MSAKKKIWTRNYPKILKILDPNFSDSDSEEYDEDNYERGVASFKETEELNISRGDTLALKRCTFCVVDKEIFCVVDKEIELQINDINSLDLSISPHFYEQYEEVCWT